MYVLLVVFHASMYFSMHDERHVCSLDDKEEPGVGMQAEKQFSLIFDIRYFALATLPAVWTAVIMRFLTCADSEAETAVGCDWGDEGEEDEEEPKGLRPPKDILGTGGGLGRTEMEISLRFDLDVVLFKLLWQFF